MPVVLSRVDVVFPAGRMPQDLEISLLGELRVRASGVDLALPASRKTRALLAFLVATGRPHRRERLCELFWDTPDDPKAALRWSLTKLRKVVDMPDQPRILADRERVRFDSESVAIDIKAIEAALKEPSAQLSYGQLESMAGQLDGIVLDGLEDVGDDAFRSWLAAERDDAEALRAGVLRRLAKHPAASTIAAAKWYRLWHEADPSAAAEAPDDPSPMSGRQRAVTKVSPTSPLNRRALREQRIGFCEASDGTKIAHATIGSGPPMVKAANWLNHLEFDWASPIWGKTFAALSRFRTFIRYDERGSGLSDWGIADLSFDAFVEDLEAVTNSLGLDRFPLLGISQGCAVSIEYAARHPERVSGLILIGGYTAGWRISASKEEQARREAVMRLTELGWGTDNPAYRHIFSQTFMPDADPGDLAWFDEFQRLTTSPVNAARFQEAFGRIDIRHRLAEIRVPTIVLHSRHDQRIPMEQGRAIAAGIPGARFVPLESRNHILVDDEPAWKTCFDAIGRFMIEHGI